MGVQTLTRGGGFEEEVCACVCVRTHAPVPAPSCNTSHVEAHTTGPCQA